MTYEWDRLRRAIRERREALRLSQAALAELAGVRLSTIQNMEGQYEYKQPPDKLGDVERALGWEAGSGRTILAGGEPTLLREPMETTIQNVDGTRESDGTPQRRSDLPMEVQLALERGQLIGVDVLRWSVHGEDFELTIVGRAGEYGTEEKRSVSMKHAEEWGRIKQALRRAAESGSASPPDDTSE